MSWRVGSSGEYVDCAAEIRSRAEFEAFVDRLFVLAECQWPTAGDDGEDETPAVAPAKKTGKPGAVADGATEPPISRDGMSTAEFSEAAKTRRARMLRMKDVEGRTLKQIAAAFATTPDSVSTTLAKARKEAGAAS